MHREIIDTIESGSIKLKLVKDPHESDEMKYWIQAGFGAIEINGRDMKDFLGVIRTYQKKYLKGRWWQWKTIT